MSSIEVLAARSILTLTNTRNESSLPISLVRSWFMRVTTTARLDLPRHRNQLPTTRGYSSKPFISALPETWIYIISIKSSLSRWNEWPRMKEANHIIRHFSRTQDRVQYIDVASPMFDTQGNLRADLFVEDGLHPTQKCYALWTSIIKPVLLQRFGPAKKVGQIPTERHAASR